MAEGHDAAAFSAGPERAAPALEELYAPSGGQRLPHVMEMDAFCAPASFATLAIARDTLLPDVHAYFCESAKPDISIGAEK
jgi:hypothetical protein